jgi:translation elongation factor EF-G
MLVDANDLSSVRAIRCEALMSYVCDGQAKYRKDSGGRGHYGHVVLRLTVGGPDTELAIENATISAVIPARYIPAIEAGIRSVIDDGKLAQRGYSAGRIELIDGSYHNMDSNDAAFFAAAALAMEDALRQLPNKPTESMGGEPSPGVRAPRPPRRPNPAGAIGVPEPENDL